MDRLNKNKLNNLMVGWPPGLPLTSKWLTAQGYYKQLVKSYCDHGWIKSVGRGAYTRLNDEITWQGVVQAVQSQLHLPVHIGGLTALQLCGVSQYTMVSHKNPTFYLYNSSSQKADLPKWVQRFFSNCHFEQKKLFNSSLGLLNKEEGGIQLIASSPERAIIEVLALVPHKITLVHADELMESLDRLRGPLVQEILEACLSIKAKRLFLYFSEKHNLSYLNELHLDRLELGSGKRKIGTGGVYHAKWLLSLPKMNEMEQGENE